MKGVAWEHVKHRHIVNPAEVRIPLTSLHITSYAIKTRSATCARAPTHGPEKGKALTHSTATWWPAQQRKQALIVSYNLLFIINFAEPQFVPPPHYHPPHHRLLNSSACESKMHLLNLRVRGRQMLCVCDMSSRGESPTWTFSPSFATP